MNDFLERQSRRWIVLVGAAATTVVGFFDFLLPDEVTLFAFYVAAILFVARYAGGKSALLVGIYSTAIWWVSRQQIPNYEIMLWRGCNRYATIAVVALGGAAMRAQRNSLRERIDFLEQRRALEEEIVRAGEREQMRIGRDLHDGLCQNLAAIDCAVACLKHDMQEQLPSQVDSTDFIHEQLRRAISEARSIAQGIFPVQTSEDGFLTAVGELVDSTSRAHRVKIILDAPAELSVHDRSVGMHLYRIIQEALNNALKHSGAAEIRVRLRAESGNLSAEVVDSGCGFQPRRSDGMGFRTMRYRAESIGGTLTIISPEEGGTAVLCSRVKNVTPTVERTKTDVAASGSREMGEAAAAPHSAPAAASEPAGICESLV